MLASQWLERGRESKREREKEVQVEDHAEKLCARTHEPTDRVNIAANLRRHSLMVLAITTRAFVYSMAYLIGRAKTDAKALLASPRTRPALLPGSRKAPPTDRAVRRATSSSAVTSEMHRSGYALDSVRWWEVRGSRL